ncbi:GNAT family N-acetyltransferase [Sporolactobacillus spathodeae]|uniref:GNAT family acetyltransferase n=1 Tax=Sporolactobacillus spathodeae TaxID=1465502 RepID=A0ABS2QA66_9BACL|nr:GNAT family N-acetyltransferase [Sporolactobacillus spathodeae]MBM7658235.1 putative GNAT family acetyltransferase [Sporolactobacillus spathodeae]
MELREGKNRFYLIDDNSNEIGEITYSFAASDVIRLTHTYVNPAYRGQNLARKLVEATAEKARKEKWQILPECSYAQVFFTRNRESYKDIL